MEDRQPSISDADKDAALTLLSAKNVVVGKNKKKKSAHPDVHGGETDGTSSDGSLAAARGTSKRVPKPPRWRSYEMREGIQSIRRPGRLPKKEKNVEWMEKHMATMYVTWGMISSSEYYDYYFYYYIDCRSIGKKPGEPVENDTLMNGSTAHGGHQYMSQEDDHHHLADGGYDVVDLHAYSQQSLYEMALVTETDHSIPPVLHQSAGVKMGKVSAFTGLDGHRKREEEGKRVQRAARKPSVVMLAHMSFEEKQSLVEQIVQAWEGENHRVWALVGKPNVPMVNRREINYLRLFLAVRDHGGYDASVAEKSWSNIARHFQMDESNIGKNGSSLRVLYKQFILPVADLLEKHAPPSAS